MSQLNSSWVLWYHDIKNNDWTINSYINIMEFNSVEDFWKLYLNINEELIINGMFFLMRKDILPIWEHEKNINGGFWSFKIPMNQIFNAWQEISMALIGEYILNDKNDIDSINGISISPKKNFSIIKIWNNGNIKEINNNTLNKKILLFNTDEAIYKLHLENEKLNI